MEPHYQLPFRSSDSRASSTWSAHPPPGYASVSSQQHFPQSHLQHQHQQHQGLDQIQQQQQQIQHPQPQPLLQQQSPFHYGQYHSTTMPAAMSYNTQQVFSYGQPYPPLAPAPPPLAPRPSVTSLMSPSGSKGLPSLPRPSHILPSQSANRSPCLACGKLECPLSSHRHFSKHVLTVARRKGQSSSQTSTPRVAQISLAVQPHAEKSQTQTRPSHLALNGEREQLLALWSREWAPVRRGPERHLFPEKFIDRILPAARSHAPLFQALLAYSGTMWAIANRMMSDVASAQQAFAVELLSQACPTETEASTDEGMLAATLLLLIYMAQGNGFEVGKHVSGLVHLAKLRGGPHYLGLSGLVAETLMYADHMQAIFFNQEPVWQLPLPALDIGLPPRFGRGFQQAITSHEIDVPLGLAARSVCRVADVFEITSSGEQLPRAIKNGFNYLCTIAEYQLARCNAAYNQTSDSDECICLALILFNQVVLRNDGATTPSILQIEHRFWHSLDAAEAKGSTLAMLPCLYMWMVMMGLTVGIRSDCQYRMLGVGKLRTARIGAGIQTWEQLRRNVLDDYVWLADAQEETFRRIWTEVEGVRSGMPTPVLSGPTRVVLPLAG